MTSGPRKHGGNEGQPPVSPWMFWSITDDDGSQAVWLSMTVTFDASNNLQTGTSFRAANCPFTRLVIGALNTDGSPATGARVVTVSQGTRNYTKAQLNAVGLATVQDILTSPQITAIP